MKSIQIKKLVMAAVLTAMVIILQLLGSFVKFGPFSISLVLIPIVVGSATCGKGIGAWLGFVFSVMVLIMDAGAFLAVNVLGTIITVIAKGTLAGFISGLVYELFKKYKTLGVFASAIVCPIVNTGVFLIGCKLFFMDKLTMWSQQAGSPSVGNYIIFILVGGNFIAELLINVVLSPVIVRILNIRNIH